MLMFWGFFSLYSMKALSTSRIRSAFIFVIVFALSSCHPFTFQLATATPPPKHGCGLEGTIQGNARSGGASLGMGTGLLTQQGLHPPHHNRMKQDSNLVAVRKKTATITSGWWVA